MKVGIAELLDIREAYCPKIVTNLPRKCFINIYHKKLTVLNVCFLINRNQFDLNIDHDCENVDIQHLIHIPTLNL